jgi:hypothetical protein
MLALLCALVVLIASPASAGADEPERAPRFSAKTMSGETFPHFSKK